MNKKLLSLPFIFWSAMFVIVPLCMVFYYGLTDKSGAFTLDNILAIATAEHSKALWEADRKSTRLNSSHRSQSRMPSSA